MNTTTDQENAVATTTTSINWKIVAATLTSTLTILAALPYQLGDLATVIPVEWKAKVVIAGLVATTILRLINTKMTVQTQTPTPVVIKQPDAAPVPVKEQPTERKP